MREAVSDPERYVVKDSERWGKQRTMLLEQRKKMEEKYATKGRFPNGQAVFEKEWKPKFVDLEEDLVQAAEEKEAQKPFVEDKNLEVEVMAGKATTGSRIPTQIWMRFLRSCSRIRITSSFRIW